MTVSSVDDIDGIKFMVAERLIKIHSAVSETVPNLYWGRQSFYGNGVSTEHYKDNRSIVLAYLYENLCNQMFVL